MVLSSHRQPAPSAALLDFLQRRMGLSSNALTLGLRQAELEQAPLPVVLDVVIVHEGVLLVASVCSHMIDDD